MVIFDIFIVSTRNRMLLPFTDLFENFCFRHIFGKINDALYHIDIEKELNAKFMKIYTSFYIFKLAKAEISALAIIILMLRNDSSYGSHENREEQMKPEETVSKCKQG